MTVAMDTTALLNSEGECGRHMGALNDNWTNITCQSPALGRWVQVQLLGLTQIHFHEVEVWGYNFM